MGIIQQAMLPSFTSEAGLLVATEGRGGIEFVVGVCPDDAGFEAGSHHQDLGALVGPDPGAEAEGCVIGFLDGFLRRAEGQDGKHRAEDLLVGDAVALGNVGEKGWREIETVARELAGGLVNFRAFVDAASHELLDLRELFL